MTHIIKKTTYTACEGDEGNRAINSVILSLHQLSCTLPNGPYAHTIRPVPSCAPHMSG
jgi:hypothetical protein